jgi:hypothetical protein
MIYNDHQYTTLQRETSLVISLIPLPPEERARADELPDWIRKALKHMKYIEDERSQEAIIALLKTYADQEIREVHEKIDEEMGIVPPED